MQATRDLQAQLENRILRGSRTIGCFHPNTVLVDTIREHRTGWPNLGTAITNRS